MALEPDQLADRWDNHVSLYEEVFEPFSLSFAEVAATRLRLEPGMSVLDVGAGAGGTALALATRACKITAVDAAAGMVERLRFRAQRLDVDIQSHVMDGQALTFPDRHFDAAISVFGVILFPDAVRGLAEMRRVVRPGGHVAIVTWTEPQNYELAAELRAAIEAVQGPGVQGPGVQGPGVASALPAQLRFRERGACEALFAAAGFGAVRIEVHSAVLRAPSAVWLADRLDFAPGMAAMLNRLGRDKDAVKQRFVASVEGKQGRHAVEFCGKAFVATAAVD